MTLIAATLPPLGGFLLLGFAGTIAPWLRAQPVAGPLVYAALFALLAGFALLPTYAQSLLGGFAFGLAVGLPAALAGFLGGALIAYLVASRASGDRVTALINENPRWRAVYDALIGRGFWRTLGIVILLRVPPNSPFALTNLLMATTRVPLGPYAIGTLLGMAPRTAIAVFLGSGLSEWSEAGRRERWWFVAGLALTVAVVVVLAALANRALRRFTGLYGTDRPGFTNPPADNRDGP